MNNVQSPQVASALARTKAGGGWFTAIAGFSLVNAVIGMIGAKIHFIVGLALCEVFDTLGQGAGPAGKGIAFVADLIVAAIWVFFASQAKKGARWAFIVGMILYVIDGGIFLLGQDFIATAFHGYVLFRLYQGLSAAGELKALQSQPAAYYGAAPQQQGAWPPPPATPAPPQFGTQPTAKPGSIPPPAQPSAYPSYQPQQPAAQQPYPQAQNLDGTPAAQPAADWSQPATLQPLPSHWPPPAQPATPEPEG